MFIKKIFRWKSTKFKLENPPKKIFSFDKKMYFSSDRSGNIPVGDHKFEYRYYSHTHIYNKFWYRKLLSTLNRTKRKEFPDIHQTFPYSLLLFICVLFSLCTSLCPSFCATCGSLFKITYSGSSCSNGSGAGLQAWLRSGSGRSNDRDQG